MCTVSRADLGESQNESRFGHRPDPTQSDNSLLLTEPLLGNFDRNIVQRLEIRMYELISKI